MKLISNERKKEISGGSFYVMALGIGILISSICSVASTVVDSTMAATNPDSKHYSASGSKRSGLYIRMAPTPWRSNVGVWI